jgi:hypothetical protein
MLSVDAEEGRLVSAEDPEVEWMADESWGRVEHHTQNCHQALLSLKPAKRSPHSEYLGRDKYTAIASMRAVALSAVARADPME